MSSLTDLLAETAANIEASGCLNDPEAAWTGRTASRVIFLDSDDQTDPDYEGHEYLYFEIADKLEDGSLDVVWIPEDCLAAAPMLTEADMAEYYTHTTSK